MVHARERGTNVLTELPTRKLPGNSRPPVGRAAVGGVVGAIVMAIWSMLLSVFLGIGFWTPIKLIAAVWFGAGALAHLSLAVLLTGLVTHLVTGAILGVILAWCLKILNLRTLTARLVGATAYGLLFWLASQYLVLPLADPLLAARMPGWVFAPAHVMFGLTTVLFLLEPTNT